MVRRFEPEEPELPPRQPELPTGPAEIATEAAAESPEAPEAKPELPKAQAPAKLAEAPRMLAKATGKLATLRDTLVLVFPTLAQLVPKGLDPQRLYVLACLAIERQPALQDCTIISIVRGVLNAAQLGLDPTGLGGQAYLIPRKNKRTGQLEACFELGYRGIITLMTRDHRIVKVVARVVRANDRFQLLCGSEEKLLHAPYIESGDPGDVEGAYAVATFANGMTQFDYMPIGDIHKIRARSEAFRAGSGPWVSDPEEMDKKTVTKRLGKYIASDPSFDYGVAQDDTAEADLAQPSFIAEDVIEAAIQASAGGGAGSVVTREIPGGAAPRRGRK